MKRHCENGLQTIVNKWEEKAVHYLSGIRRNFTAELSALIVSNSKASTAHVWQTLHSEYILVCCAKSITCGLSLNLSIKIHVYFFLILALSLTKSFFGLSSTVTYYNSTSFRPVVPTYHGFQISNVPAQTCTNTIHLLAFGTVGFWSTSGSRWLQLEAC